MKRRRSIHAVDSKHLRLVLAELQKLVAPTIRVVDLGDWYQAIEGTHRLAACEQLGIVPVLKVLGLEDEVDLTTLDMDDVRTTLGDSAPA